MITTAEKHLAAIRRRHIERGNVIGIRKALNAAWRSEHGYSVSSTAPRLKPNTAHQLQSALAYHEPFVFGPLVATGRTVLCNDRWRKRWNAEQQAIINNLVQFRLVRFDDVHNGNFVPVYRVVDHRGNSFLFRNISWQTASAYGLESGPEPVGDW